MIDRVEVGLVLRLDLQLVVLLVLHGVDLGPPFLGVDEFLVQRGVVAVQQVLGGGLLNLEPQWFGKPMDKHLLLDPLDRVPAHALGHVSGSIPTGGGDSVISMR